MHSSIYQSSRSPLSPLEPIKKTSCISNLAEKLLELKVKIKNLIRFSLRPVWVRPWLFGQPRTSNHLSIPGVFSYVKSSWTIVNCLWICLMRFFSSAGSFFSTKRFASHWDKPWFLISSPLKCSFFKPVIRLLHISESRNNGNAL